MPLDAYYDSTRKTYLITDKDDDWMCVDREAIKHRLALKGYRMRADKSELLSPADAAVVRIQNERNVSYAGPLAGFARGVRWINGVKVLVTHSPRMLTPVNGEWNLIRTLVDQQLEPHAPCMIDQRPYWHAWVKLGLKALRSCIATGHVTYGQVMILVGNKGCGKSLLQHLLTQILGGRVAYPFQFMSGQTPFNRELFANEHQMIEDEQEHKDTKNRVRFGSALKQIAAKIEHPCYGKGRDGQTLTPFWRCSFSVNDDTEHLEVLPPFSDSMMDKVLLLHCRKLPMPMPAGNNEEKAIFWQALMKELPAYIHWLENEFVIPAEVADPARYGIREFMHPRVMMLLDDLLPETRLLSLIDHVMFQDGRTEWDGTSEELTKTLYEHPGYVTQAKALLSSGGACGKLLSQLAKRHPDRVVENRTESARKWRLMFKLGDTPAPRPPAPPADGMTADLAILPPP